MRNFIKILKQITQIDRFVFCFRQAGKKPGSLGAGLPANLALRGRILRSRGKILGSRGTILGSLGIFLNSRRHTKSKTITTELVALTYLGIDISQNCLAVCICYSVCVYHCLCSLSFSQNVFNFLATSLKTILVTLSTTCIIKPGIEIQLTHRYAIY